MPFDGTNYDTHVSNPVTELLEQAWAMIDKPQKWTRGQPESVDGRRLCSLNALHTATTSRADFRNPFPSHIIAMVILAKAMGRSGPAMPSAIASFNDCHSHREVAAAWQRAIAMSRTMP